LWREAVDVDVGVDVGIGVDVDVDVDLWFVVCDLRCVICGVWWTMK
jgi:hypothetical protein